MMTSNKPVKVFTNLLIVNPEWYGQIKTMTVYVYTVSKSEENEVKSFLKGKCYVPVPDDKSNTIFIYSFDLLEVEPQNVLNFYKVCKFSELIRNSEHIARNLLTRYLKMKFSKELSRLAKEIKERYLKEVCEHLKNYDIEIDVSISLRVQKLDDKNCHISLYMRCNFDHKLWLSEIKESNPELYENLIIWMKNGEIREFKYLNSQNNFSSAKILKVVDDREEIKKILNETVQDGGLTLDKIKESVKRVRGQEISEEDIDLLIIRDGGYKFVPHNIKLTLRFDVLKKIIGDLSILSKIIKTRYKCLYSAIQEICKLARDNGVQPFISQRISECETNIKAKFVYYDLDGDKVVIRRKHLRNLSLDNLNVFIPIKARERNINVIFVTPENPRKLAVCMHLINLREKINKSLEKLDGKIIDKNPITGEVPTKESVLKLNIHPKPIDLRRYKKNGKYEFKRLANDIKSQFKSIKSDGELNLVLVIIPDDLDYDLLRNELLRRGLYVQGIKIENANNKHAINSLLYQIFPKLGIYFYTLEIDTQYDFIIGFDTTREYQDSNKAGYGGATTVQDNQGCVRSVIPIGLPQLPKESARVGKILDILESELYDVFSEVETKKGVVKLLILKDGVLTNEEKAGIKEFLLKISEINFEITVMCVVKDTKVYAWHNYYNNVNTYIKLADDCYVLISHYGAKTEPYGKNVVFDYECCPILRDKYVFVKNEESINIAKENITEEEVKLIINLQKMVYAQTLPDKVKLPMPLHLSHKFINFVRKFEDAVEEHRANLKEGKLIFI